MSKGGCLKALTTWEKQYAVHLVTIGGLETIVEAIRDLKHERKVNNCICIGKNVLKEARLAA